MATELDKYYDSPTVGPICYYTKDLVVVELWSVICDHMPDWKEFKIVIKVYLPSYCQINTFYIFKIYFKDSNLLH